NITLTAEDEQQQTASTSFVVNVSEVQTQTPFFDLVDEAFQIVDNIIVDEDFDQEITVSAQPEENIEGVTYSIAPSSIAFATLTANNDEGIYAFEAVADQNGEQEFTVTANNQGSIHEENFTFRVNAVNDQPIFSLAQNNINVEAASGPQSFANFANNIAPGPETATDEASQILAFTVSAENPSLFSILPIIDEETGTLTFTPSENSIGTSTMEVTLTDDGPENGENQNSSATSFNIEIFERQNAVPVISGQEDITIDEDNSYTIELDDLEVSDPDHDITELTLIVQDGDNYTRN
ncbi:hypothetical protein WJR50_11905, partial [Catalinimonas sp. 4WD22]|uniref:hypothetical protein n=1 Tax=Catalinimonas locisalis TaxID=3133978 RepID=UPI0031012E04